LVAVGVLALPVALSALLAVLVAGGLVAGGAWAFADAQLLLDGVSPAVGVMIVFLAMSVLQHRIASRERQFIRGAFARYVSPNLVDYLVQHPDSLDLGGQRRICSFVFTDLAGFTRLMEKLDPGKAVSLLNAYLDGLIAIAFRHHGTLDRIVGDAVAIMFSAPVEQEDHAERAVACAREMQAFSAEYAERVRAGGVEFGFTRIGVHSGEVIVGNFGGGSVFDYRALGDPVNTAARLESVNRHLGTRTCVSGATVALCPEFTGRPVAELVLKGKTEAVSTFEPLSAEEMASDRVRRYLAAHALLVKGDLDGARVILEELIQAYPDDSLVRLHLSRIRAGEGGVRMVMDSK